MKVRNALNNPYSHIFKMNHEEDYKPQVGDHLMIYCIKCGAIHNCEVVMTYKDSSKEFTVNNHKPPLEQCPKDKESEPLIKDKELVNA